jgi:hypothetical protein
VEEERRRRDAEDKSEALEAAVAEAAKELQPVQAELGSGSGTPVVYGGPFTAARCPTAL